MNHQRLARFVRKWFAEWMPETPVFGHATALLTQLIQVRPDEAWERILALVACAPDEEAIGYVGAGPLEDFLIAHGQAFIDRVEATAISDARFAACLATVWGSNSIDSGVYARISRTVQSTQKAF
jgi:hypothetical protein